MTGRDGSHAWTGRAQMGLQKGKRNYSYFCGSDDVWSWASLRYTDPQSVPCASPSLSQPKAGRVSELGQHVCPGGLKTINTVKKQIEHSCSQMGKQANHSFQREHPCQARMSSGSSCTEHFSTLLLNRKRFQTLATTTHLKTRDIKPVRG